MRQGVSVWNPVQRKPVQLHGTGALALRSGVRQPDHEHATERHELRHMRHELRGRRDLPGRGLQVPGRQDPLRRCLHRYYGRQQQLRGVWRRVSDRNAVHQ
jgi:hypothetical protein